MKSELVLLSLLLVPEAAGQNLVSASTTLDSAGATVFRGSFEFLPKPFLIPPTSAAPYSAEEVSERIQSDGTRSEAAQTVRRIYRDSQGRTRVERTLYLGPGA